MRFLFVFGLLVACSAVVAFPSEPKPDRSGPPEVRAYNEGVALIEGGRFSSAAGRFRAALAGNKDFAEAHNNLGYALRQQGPEFYDEALEHYNRAIELNPLLAEAYMYRGALFVKMDRLESAERDLIALRMLRPALAVQLMHVMRDGEDHLLEEYLGVSPRKDL